MKNHVLIGIACMVFAVAAGCGRGSKPVAKVFGDNLSQDDLYKTMESYGTGISPTVLVNTGSGDTARATLAEPMTFQAMHDLLQRKATIEVARQDGVAPTPKDVDDEINFRGVLNNKQYVPTMTKMGLTMSRIREVVEFELARERLLTEGISVTTAEAKQFVADHPTAFMDPELADLQYILLIGQSDKELADKEAATDKELRAGQMFGYVAQTHSDDRTSAQNNGQYRVNVVSKMPLQVQNVVHTTDESKTTESWIPMGRFAAAKFYVNKKQQAKKRNMDDPHIEMLRREMAVERGGLGKDLNERVTRLLVNSKDGISIDDGNLKDSWKDWVDKVKKSRPDLVVGSAKPSAK